MSISNSEKLDPCEYEVECLGDGDETTYHTCILVDRGFSCPYSVRRCLFKMEQEEFINYFLGIYIKNNKEV